MRIVSERERGITDHCIKIYFWLCRMSKVSYTGKTESHAILLCGGRGVCGLRKILKSV